MAVTKKINFQESSMYFNFLIFFNNLRPRNRNHSALGVICHVWLVLGLVKTAKTQIFVQ